MGERDQSWEVERERVKFAYDWTIAFAFSLIKAILTYIWFKMLVGLLIFEGADFITQMDRSK